jgi:tripartite-type tricarboxylate transporter receptor subunit TctC
VQARLHKDVVATLAEPELVAKLKAQYMAPIAGSPAEFRALLEQERSRWAPIMTAGGIKVE